MSKIQNRYTLVTNQDLTCMYCKILIVMVQIEVLLSILLEQAKSEIKTLDDFVL